jgi:SAM-dependent methyltransferase
MSPDQQLCQRGFLAPGKHFTGYLDRVSLLRALERLRPYVRPGRFLDVGCGIKPYRSLLSPPGSEYWGVDYPLTMAGSYNAATRADVFADCQRLPFSNAVFDTLICTQVLEHVPNPGALIGEMARVLRPGGTLILTAPMTWPLHEEPYDFYRYTLHGLRALLGAAGLRVLAETPSSGAAAALGQVFLDVYFARPGRHSLWWKVYSRTVALVVNQICLWFDRLCPRSRFCLGWGVAAQKQVEG